ncbi:MAG: CPBP family intramembrane metalloprotease [Micrococcus sp.]|nr:CPBP family intramembrane metalloprotease [Micrococcus sp.]
MTKRRPYLFLALVLAASVPFYLLNAIDVTMPLGLPPSALMIVVPFAGAAILLSREGGRSALAEWSAAAVDVRSARPGWLAVAILAPVALSGLAYVITGVTHPATAQRGPLEASLTVVLAIYLAYWLGAILEELGWTTYVTPPLQERHGVLGAGILIGVVWAAWHVIPWLAMGRSVRWVVLQCLVTIGLRVVMGLIFQRSGGATSTAIFFHAGINAAPQILPGGFDAYDPGAYAIVVWLTVLAAALMTQLTQQRRS